MDIDLVEKLLQTTGLSCDDLLVKLQQYKAQQPSKSEISKQEKPVSDQNGLKSCTTNNDNSVILETKSCAIECSDNTRLANCCQVDASENTHLSAEASQSLVERCDEETLDVLDESENTHLSAETSQSLVERCDEEALDVLDESENTHLSDETSHSFVERCDEEALDVLDESDNTHLSAETSQSLVERCDEEALDLLDESENTHLSAETSQSFVQKCDEEALGILDESEKRAKENVDAKASILQALDKALDDIEKSKECEKENVSSKTQVPLVEKRDEEAVSNVDDATARLESFDETLEAITEDSDEESANCNVASETSKSFDAEVSEKFSETSATIVERQDEEILNGGNIAASNSESIVESYDKNALNFMEANETSELIVGNIKIDKKCVKENETETSESIFESRDEEDCNDVNESEKNVVGTIETVNESNKRTHANRKDDGEESKVTSEDSPDNPSSSSDTGVNKLDPEQENSTSSTGLWSDVTSNTFESATDVLPEVSTFSAKDVPKSEDSLRDILRMQLSSLRNMKKSNGYLPDLKKRSTFFHNLRKKRKSCDVNTLKSFDKKEALEDSTESERKSCSVNILKLLGKNADSEDSTEPQQESCDDNTLRSSEKIVEDEGSTKYKNADSEDSIEPQQESCDVDTLKSLEKIEENEGSTQPEENNNKDKKSLCANEDSWISLSDETDFVIVNVTGGIDRLTPDLKEDEGNEENETSNNEETANLDLLKSVNSNDVAPKMNPSKKMKGILTDYRRKMSLNYFDANSYNFSTPKLQEMPANITVKKNLSENFDEDPGINKSAKNSEKSPFVSDSLDDFLNESSQLKISYAIPKLGAEEGINESTKEISPFDNMIKAPKIETTSREKPKLIKAKTLADMRRQFEKLNAKEKATEESRRKYQKRLKDTSLGSQEQLSAINTTQISPHRKSFMLINNKKIWLATRDANRCVAVLSEKDRGGETQAVNRKPSLLSSLQQQRPHKISYKPGPLCKKINLQNVESRDEWTSELKTLPKIYLEVSPEFKKPIDSKVLHLLPIFDECVITEERTHFALTALKPKDDTVESKSFMFQIPYKNNQEQVIVRRAKEPLVYKGDPCNNDTDSTKIIESVLNDIISYIEVKEIENTLIKDDDTFYDAEEGEDVPKFKIRKKQIRKNKLDLELLRLNCKVIDVGTTEAENTKCLKAYCKMGCVCKSLLCQSAFSNHCQLVECMFGCKCPPLVTNEMNLTANTVTHLEDRVKKHLAKEEREFTQTLIQTGNDVILLGTGKIRRASKMPKKYTDFFEDIDDIFEKSVSAVPKERKKLELKKCDIVLNKLNLENIRPYCLFHKIYDCFCKGEYVESLPKAKTVDVLKNLTVKTKEDQDKLSDEGCARIRKVFSQYKDRNKHPLYNSKLWKKQNYLDTLQLDQNEEFDKVNVTIDEAEFVKKPSKRKQSFNIREEFFQGNQSKPKTKRKKKVHKFPINKEITQWHSQKQDNSEFSTDREEMQWDLQNQKKNEDHAYNFSVGEAENEYCVSAKEEKQWSFSDRRKRKYSNPSFSPDKEETFLPAEREFALQRRKKKVKVNLSTKKVSLYQAIFDGEIKLSLKDNEEMLSLVGKQKFPLDYLRILPWPKLIENFESRKISIWSKEDGSVLMCNAAGYLPPKNFIDIRKVIRRSEIIEWILTDNLPPDRPRHLMHLILTPRKQHFMISGYCLKKIKDNSKGVEEEITDEESNSNRNELQLNQFKEIGPNKRIPTPLVFKTNNEQISDLESNSNRKFIRVSSVLKNVDGDMNVVPASLKFKKINANSDVDLESNSNRKLSSVLKSSNYQRVNVLQSVLIRNADNPGAELLDAIEAIQRSPTKRSSTNAEAEPLKLKAVTKSLKSMSRSEIQLHNGAPEEIRRKQVSGGTPDVEINLVAEDDSEVIDVVNTVSLPQTVVLQNSEKTLDLPKKNVEAYVGTYRADDTKKTSPSKKTNPQLKEKADKDVDAIFANRLLKCTHKNMNNENKTLILTGKVFTRRRLRSKCDQRVDISAPLPNVFNTYRWRMIGLNSDFSYLSFVKANYSIKYTDLSDVVKMSNTVGMTITIRNKEFTSHYKHPIFGIFCVPEFQDRLFIGPYLPTEEHNIDTFRYLQGKLIDTQTFNKMVGRKGNGKVPTWIYEVSCRSTLVSKEIVIDITEDEKEDEIIKVDDISERTTPEYSITDFLCPPFVTELNQEELKSKQYINRYIVTNIPHLGYFGARQRDSKAIEVFWPNDTKGYRFPNVTFAKHVLIQYLSQFFCPIPPHFKINVIIMTQLDLQSNVPVNAKYFSQPGPFFCGEFGIYEKNKVPEELLKQYDISSVNSLLKAHQESQNNKDALIRLFGLFLMSNEELRKHTEPEQILQWAHSEMYILKKLHNNYESEKNDLHTIIRTNAQRLARKRQEQVGVQDVPETIEIPDSDEERDPLSTENDKFISPPSPPVFFKKICTSGRVDTSRSLLKPKTWTAPGHSLLKSNEEEVPIQSNQSVLKNNKLLLSDLNNLLG